MIPSYLPFARVFPLCEMLVNASLYSSLKVHLAGTALRIRLLSRNLKLGPTSHLSCMLSVSMAPLLKSKSSF